MLLAPATGCRACTAPTRSLLPLLLPACCGCRAAVLPARCCGHPQGAADGGGPGLHPEAHLIQAAAGAGAPHQPQVLPRPCCPAGMHACMHAARLAWTPNMPQLPLIDKTDALSAGLPGSVCRCGCAGGTALPPLPRRRMRGRTRARRWTLTSCRPRQAGRQAAAALHSSGGRTSGGRAAATLPVAVT